MRQHQPHNPARNPAEGEGPCPLCALAGESGTATLHRESKGRFYYLRCDECGTLQPRAWGGQEHIAALIKNGTYRLYRGEPAGEPVKVPPGTGATKEPPPDPAPKPEPAPAAPAQRSGGLMDLARDFGRKFLEEE